MSLILKNKRVLIVDDYCANKELFSIFVENAGGIVFGANNGKECLKIIEKELIDLVLMDKNMPEMNGVEAAKEIRKMHSGKDVIIIGITGSDDKADIDECLEAGMDIALAKTSCSFQKIIEIASGLLS
jgi:two-component system chemotaxis sensor kinase CheA